MTRVYLSGPITGDPDARAKFKTVQHALEAGGRQVINPFDVGACAARQCLGEVVNGVFKHSWECYLRYDLMAMLKCDRVMALPGFEGSPGARLELFVATQVGIPIDVWNLRSLEDTS